MSDSVNATLWSKLASEYGECYTYGQQLKGLEVRCEVWLASVCEPWSIFGLLPVCVLRCDLVPFLFSGYGKLLGKIVHGVRITNLVLFSPLTMSLACLYIAFPSVA